MSGISWVKNHFVTTALVLVPLLAFMIHVGHGRANAQNGFANDNNGAQDAIQIRYAVAPFQLNTTGLDSDLVGLGSYIVNVTGDCNGCHSAGPQSEFLAKASADHPTNGLFVLSYGSRYSRKLILMSNGSSAG